jgi:2-keto-myo-inositol isomerase
MLAFALTDMTVARLSFAGLLEAAAALGFWGWRSATTLPQPRFNGSRPKRPERWRASGPRILALAEVKRFKRLVRDKAAEALALMRLARDCGAEAVALIPRNDNGGMGNGERQAHLRVALKSLRPMLEDHGLVGLVEPLGFEICALRHKAEAVEAIEALGAQGTFRLVHDTFHHHLAGGGPIFPQHTGLVHVSGVTDPALSLGEMADRHRVLVDGTDRLGNLRQLAELQAAGWAGPVSFEAFAPETHALPDPVGALRASMEFMRSQLAAKAA